MIYIACLPSFATGGTELLHQLGSEIIKNGIEAKMLYHNANGNPVVQRFEKYNVPYALSIENVCDTDMLIVPEILTDLLYEWKGIKKIIWWLSVDFFFKSRYSKRNLIRRFILRKKFFGFNDSDVLHYVQSRYAFDFLKSKGIEPSGWLSDYLGDEFIQSAIVGCNEFEKNPVVLYNPKKGLNYTNRIISLTPRVNFIAIQSMTPFEVSRLMQTSALYIDFGNHPGKDRIPREAAISGCCVIVGKQGSASNSTDVPIPEKFKFNVDDAGLQLASLRIGEILAQPEKYLPMFAGYRQSILEEKEIFSKQVIDFIKNNGVGKNPSIFKQISI